jgi:hypothetical protein
LEILDAQIKESRDKQKFYENNLILRNITFGVSQIVYEGNGNVDLLIQRYKVFNNIIIFFV